MKSLFYFLLAIAAAAPWCSCKKFVQVSNPQTEITGQTVFASDQSATAAMLGIYSQIMQAPGNFAGGNMTLLCGLSADELINYSNASDYIQLYENAITPQNGNTGSTWTEAYQIIYDANAILEGLQSSAVSQPVKQQLRGEAEFMRAFSYFYLVNLYGDVPLITSTGYASNAVATRTAAALVYNQIIGDLTDAQAVLAADYSYSGGERVRPNAAAAAALLARVYLFRGDWKDAEAQASLVINNNLFSLTGLDSVFLANSNEAILQFEPVLPGFNEFEAEMFILTRKPTTRSLTASVMDSFETGDFRKSFWTGIVVSGTDTFYFPYKYKVYYVTPVTEYYMVLRLAEQYLIRAEARAEQGINMAGALSDLNVIRYRAGLSPVITTATDSLLQAIRHERQIEFLAEWGHRWFDLKRTGNINGVLGTLKPGWKPTAALFPIPATERQNDPNLTQNEGY